MSNKHYALTLLVTLLMLPVLQASADDLQSNTAADPDQPLDLEIEELVITAKEPDWKKPKDEEDWRPDRFELQEPDSQQRFEWLPEYTRDERDDYNQVRDRMNEEPDIKLFKWRF